MRSIEETQAHDIKGAVSDYDKKKQKTTHQYMLLMLKCLKNSAKQLNIQ